MAEDNKRYDDCTLCGNERDVQQAVFTPAGWICFTCIEELNRLVELKEGEKKGLHKEYECNFCGEAFPLSCIVIGPNINICRNCMELANAVLEEKEKAYFKKMQTKEKEEEFDAFDYEFGGHFKD